MNNASKRQGCCGILLGIAVLAYLCVLHDRSKVQADESDSNGTYVSKDTSAARGNEITYFGCLYHDVHRKGWVLVGLEQRDDQGEINTAFNLVGNTRAVDKYRDCAALAVRGIVLTPPHDGAFGQSISGELKVQHVEELHPLAKLAKSITNASDWDRRSDKTYGLTYEFPPEDASLKSDFPLSANVAPNTTEIFDLGLEVYPESRVKRGRLRIYAAPEANQEEPHSYADTESYSDKPDQWATRSQRINGVQYTLVCRGGVRLLNCAASTIRNHIAYKFEFAVFIGQPGMLEWGCLEPEITPDQARSFLRLLVSRVVFSKPADFGEAR